MWQQLSFDTAVHHADALRFLIDTEGGDRVLLGSNFAGWDVEDRYQELLAGLRLPANSQVAILGDNARPIFRLG